MITLLSGNSRILLNIDDRGRWSELYHPHAGMFQHLHDARLGVFDAASEEFGWIGDEATMPTRQEYLEDSNAARSVYETLGFGIDVDDVVHPNLDLIIRRVTFREQSGQDRDLRVFHAQGLTILESLYQDTAYWDQQRRTITHYKRHHYFQFWGRPDFDSYTCGEHTLKGLKGSYVDAEDGELGGNPISHGAADSVVQWNVTVPAGGSTTVHLLVMFGESRKEVNDFYDDLTPRDPDQLVREAVSYWNHWIDAKRQPPAAGLSEKAQRVYKRSVYVLRDCASETGAVVASPDPRTLKSGGDNYNYCWWRDAGYVSKAMDEVGLYQNAHRFLSFARECQEEEGYFLHRHFPDGAVGSTWHPPPFLQIDQTGTVVASVWHHFKKHQDLDELLEFWPLVRDAADFMMRFVDERGLPRPSFDLWEEKKAVNAYSVAAVVSGLDAAVRVGERLGKRTAFWEEARDRMRAAALEHLWNEKKQTLYKSIEPVDDTVDASTLLAIKLDLIPPADPRAAKIVQAVEDRLWVEKTGGVARYEGDTYWGKENPWLICTLWLAEAHLLLGDPDRCRELIEWVAATGSPTDLLPEQVDAKTGEHTSVTPLVWSHSTFLDVVNELARVVPRKPETPEAAPA